jgi:hypothetical protein
MEIFYSLITQELIKQRIATQPDRSNHPRRSRGMIPKARSADMEKSNEDMWRELGLNLASHEVLLNVLGKAYQDIFL